MNRAVATFAFAVVAVASPARTQERSLPMLAVSSQGKPVAPADIVVTLVHEIPRDSRCIEQASGRMCENPAHWQVELRTGGSGFPRVVIGMQKRDELVNCLRIAAAPKMRDKRPSVSDATLSIRADRAAPCGMVLGMLVAAGVWRTEFAVANAQGMEERLEVPLPVGEGGLHEEMPRTTEVALFLDRTTGQCLRAVDHEQIPAGVDGDKKLREVLAKAAKAGPAESKWQILFVAESCVPWQAAVTALDACVAICKDVEFPTPDRWAGSVPDNEIGWYSELRHAFLNGEGWRALTLADFVNVNGTADTWTEQDGVIRGTGKPLGGARTRTQFTNFELVLEWKHLEYAGNSGVFVWCPESAFTDLPAGTLPRSGIEVQVLDLGYEDQWLKDKGKRSDWFTSHGDVFPVGTSTMTPFTPQITYRLQDGESFTVGNAKSSRCFPTKRLTNGVGEWNHYYIRAINGEIRLWVNGEEVSGGTKCNPPRGYLALEAEGAKVEFRNLRIRELP